MYKTIYPRFVSQQLWLWQIQIKHKFYSIIFNYIFSPQGYHQYEEKNKKYIIYSQFCMDLKSQNLSVFIFMWLYLIWEEQHWNKTCITMFIVFKRQGQEYINIK